MQSRNQREGYYAGRWPANMWSNHRHRRMPYGAGMFITLTEYGKMNRVRVREALIYACQSKKAASL